MRGFLYCVCCVLCAVWSEPSVGGVAWGQDKGPSPIKPASAWHLEAEIFTDFPIQVAGQVGVELPRGIRITTSLGILPEPYMATINGVVTAAGGYSEETGELILAILKNSLLWRLQAGWKPWENHGFYFEAGYMLLTLGGGINSAEALSLATGRQPPDAANVGDRTGYEVSSTLHMLTAEVGWRWLFWDDLLLLRTGFAFAGTIASSTAASPSFNPRNPAARQASEEFANFIEDYLNETYTTYVFSPGVSLSVGWRFF